MATQRAVPGATLPESGSSTSPTGRSGASDVHTVGGESFGTSSSAAPGPTNTADDKPSFTDEAKRQFPQAAGVLGEVKQQAATRVNEQKARAADGLGSVASAIRQASDQLRTENQTLAAYTDKAVDQIQLLADRVRDKEPAEMLRDIEQFGRRNPAAFVGGAFLLGLGLARFLKSSGDIGYTGRTLAHRDSDFGNRAAAGTSGDDRAGFSGTGDFARADDLSRMPGGLSSGRTDRATGLDS